MLCRIKHARPVESHTMCAAQPLYEIAIHVSVEAAVFRVGALLMQEVKTAYHAALSVMTKNIWSEKPGYKKIDMKSPYAIMQKHLQTINTPNTEQPTKLAGISYAARTACRAHSSAKHVPNPS